MPQSSNNASSGSGSGSGGSGYTVTSSGTNSAVRSLPTTYPTPANASTGQPLLLTGLRLQRVQFQLLPLLQHKRILLLQQLERTYGLSSRSSILIQRYRARLTTTLVTDTQSTLLANRR